MALRRERRRVATGHAGDDAQLRRLAEPDRPHTWRHYLYCRDERGCESVSAEARAVGWSVTRAGRSVDLPGCVVVAECSTVLTPETVAATRAWWEDLAARTDGGRYDGWEPVD